MTFTTKVKEEMTTLVTDKIETSCELSAFIRFDGQIKKDHITLTIENAGIARRIYKAIKELYNVSAKIIVRNQKRFRVKQIYILEIFEKVDIILASLAIVKDNKVVLPDEYYLESNEEKIAYIRGIFLSCGSLNDPSRSGYHLEFTISTKKEATFISSLLKKFYITSKILKRSNHYMVYVKSAEMISDLIRMFGAYNSLFYFEDIRIYRDHKNMVNRLNNCEIANTEKTIKTGLKQLEAIKYLKDNDLIDLLDDRIKEVISYREKYPETSYSELAEIISMETGKKIGKSGINHYFIKINKLVENHKERSSI
ncbi:MAG: DNA-binding protein WhiA [Bacilli bacterium]